MAQFEMMNHSDSQLSTPQSHTEPDASTDTNPEVQVIVEDPYGPSPQPQEYSFQPVQPPQLPDQAASLADYHPDPQAPTPASPILSPSSPPLPPILPSSELAQSSNSILKRLSQRIRPTPINSVPLADEQPANVGQENS